MAALAKMDDEGVGEGRSGSPSPSEADSPRQDGSDEEEIGADYVDLQRELELELVEQGSSWWEAKRGRLAAWGVDILDALSETNDDLRRAASTKKSPSNKKFHFNELVLGTYLRPERRCPWELQTDSGLEASDARGAGVRGDRGGAGGRRALAPSSLHAHPRAALLLHSAPGMAASSRPRHPPPPTRPQLPHPPPVPPPNSSAPPLRGLLDVRYCRGIAVNLRFVPWREMEEIRLEDTKLITRVLRATAYWLHIAADVMEKSKKFKTAVSAKGTNPF